MLDDQGTLISGEVRIETTNFCNGHCLMCPREKLTRPLTTMPYSHFKYLVEQADEMGAHTISPFGFGEPLMDKELPDKILLCSEKGFDTFITTNASLLGPKHAIYLLEAGLTHIRFSVHSVYKDMYEYIQYPLKYDNVLRNIYTFLDINETQFHHSCETSVTVIPQVSERIGEIREFWGDKVDNLECWLPHNWLTGRKYRNVAWPSKHKKRMSCGRPFRGPVQIQADGTVIPCCFLTNSEFVVGNTYDKSIKDILNGYLYQWLREMHRRTKDCYPCMLCDQYYESDESPLLYSSRDPDCEAGRVSSTKFKLVAN